MARTDTLTNYLTDIADAIREKTGSSETIQASSFDTAIENIPSGGGEPNWSEIGYSNAPDYVMTAFNYAKDIYDNWDSSTTTMQNLYNGNTELVYMPLVDTSNVTNMNNTFYSCTNLQSIPQLNTSNVTNMQYAFSGCNQLKIIPQLNTSKVTTMAGMFNGCSKLTSIPQFDTSNVTNMANFCTNCMKITSFPQLNTSEVTTMSSMLTSCSGLVSIPELDAGNVANISYAINYCSNLENFGGFKDLGKAYSKNYMENYSNYTLNLSSCKSLTHESLMNVINNLYDIKTKGCKNQNLNLGSTNLAKLTAEEIAIATNKGWNVT